jgi:pimeloyl-ACP methyl ester carboxylesterase
MLRGRLGHLLLFCAGLYLLICTGCAAFQRRLIYFPPVYSSGQAGQMAQAAKLERWKNPAGESIGLKRVSPRQPAEGSVLIAYGNGDHAAGYSFYADELQSQGSFDVYILEYPGYADRLGSPSQGSLFRAADEALQLLPTNGPVYLVGQSLGTGVAAYLAGTYPNRVAGVILISPYDRLTGVAQYHMPLLPVGLLLVDRFPSEDYLRNYQGPVGMVVDGHDRVVPEKFGRRLYDGYAGPKHLWEFPNGEHAAIMEQPEKFWKEAVEFWQTNRPPKMQQPK